MLAILAAFLLDLATAEQRGACDLVLEIILPQQQVRLLQHQSPQPTRLVRAEQLTLAVVAAALARLASGPRLRFERCVLLFVPDTILRWYRELVRRNKRTHRRAKPGGHPTIAPRWSSLILWLARENPRRGHRDGGHALSNADAERWDRSARAECLDHLVRLKMACWIPA